MLKAQLGAVAGALGDVSGAVTRFLENVAAPSEASSASAASAGTLASPADSTAVPLALTPATFEYTQDLREHERVGRRASF